jgi:hypothetical protein
MAKQLRGKATRDDITLAHAVRVLVWWKARTKGEAGDLVLGLDLGQGSHWLRGRDCDPKTRHVERVGDLMLAGVDRAELFERSAARQPIRLHDLRASFVTVALATGKTERWVTDRTGHRSSQMLALYARQARTWAELDLGTWRPLDVLLPEIEDTTEPVKTPEAVAPPTPPTPIRGLPMTRGKGSDCPAIAPWIAPAARVELAANALGKR